MTSGIILYWDFTLTTTASSDTGSPIHLCMPAVQSYPCKQKNRQIFHNLVLAYYDLYPASVFSYQNNRKTNFCFNSLFWKFFFNSDEVNHRNQFFFFSKLTVFKLPPPLPPIIRNDKGLTLQLCCEAIWNDCSLFQ